MLKRISQDEILYTSLTLWNTKQPLFSVNHIRAGAVVQRNTGDRCLADKEPKV